MNSQKAKDIQDTALKLNDIYTKCPEDFFFVKGWIHCLLRKENTICQQSAKSSKTDYTVT